MYASTRADELASVPWSEAETDTFLRFQFEAQQTHYYEHFPDASYELVLDDDGEVIGRLYVDRRTDEIRIVDVALLPPYRDQGIGSKLLRTILKEAQQRGVPVRIHVEHNNPAMNLYVRLGFRKIEELGVYHLMESTALLGQGSS